MCQYFYYISVLTINMMIVGDAKTLLASCCCCCCRRHDQRSNDSSTRRVLYPRPRPHRLLYKLIMVIMVVATVSLRTSSASLCCNAASTAFIPSSSSSSRTSIRINHHPVFQKTFTTTSTRSAAIEQLLQHPKRPQGDDGEHYRMSSMLLLGSKKKQSESEEEENIALLFSKQKDNTTSSSSSLSSSSSTLTTTTTTTTTTTRSNSRKGSILDRFIAPRIDDPALPLSDVLVAQIIAPTLELVWLASRAAPVLPSWLQPIFATTSMSTLRGSLLAPLLIHGAALASCWLLGALAARAYEDPAVRFPAVAQAPPLVATNQRGDSSKNKNKDEYGNGIVLSRVLQAGAFATGLLILGTQLDLLLEFQGHFVQWGDSPEVDFRLQVAAVEVLNDVVFEAVTLIAWRLGVALQKQC